MAVSEPNYTKEAFLTPFNLVFLIVAMLSAFLLADIAAVPETLLLFAAALELLYLGTFPKNERFRRAVRSREIAERQKPPSEKEVIQTLHKGSQKRYVRFRNLEKQIAANYDKLPYTSQGMLEAHRKKLDGLLDSYLNLLQLRERYERFTERTAEAEIARAMSELRDEIASDPPKVAAIKRKRYGILEKRLDKFKRAKENLLVIEAQLETIEDVTKYVYEQSLTMRNPDEVTFQLDTLVQEVEETQATVEELEGVFSGGYDTLGSEDLEASDLDAPELDAPRLDLDSLSRPGGTLDEPLPDDPSAVRRRTRS